MSTDSETEKCDPLNISTKTEEIVAFDEVKSFLPIDEPPCSESNEKESDADPLGYENDPLSDSELPQTTEESKPTFEKFNGQSTPLRTYAGKRPRKSSLVSEVEGIKKPKIDDTDSEDLETLLAGAPKTEEEKQNKDQLDNGDYTAELEEEKASKSNTVNGNVIVDDGCFYTLVCRTGRPGRKRILKNNLGFEKLMHQLKLIRLPAPNWKIKIFVTRDQQISEITFANKLPNERCVKFSRSSITYVITFNSQVVTLVGAPSSIDSPSDITRLLEILNTLDDDDPLIEYNPSTK
ncbi:uncharacterized protein LOC108738456 isoform X2 [Agrilus planipennis]|nr:uncharacterized protein LOC108738456 isoform X2 [Agrilus planipennis]